MKRKVVWALLTLAVLVGASLSYTGSAASSSSNERINAARAAAAAPILMPFFATTLTVDRTDDTAAATACTGAANDCSLRGAIRAANADLSANPVVINLQPATTYNLTLTNATQENAAATGDLDINTTLHTVTIAGGGSSGPNATVIDAAGLNTGSVRDRAFQITGPGVTAIFQDLVIRNGKAADDGTSGASTNPANQNTQRAGGGILNNGGSVTLQNVRIQSCQAVGRGDSNANFPGILDARGGGLASLGATGSITITNSRLSNNVAQGGDGPAGVNNNQASNAKGGSVYFEGGTLDIEASRIENSNANGGGGNGGNGGQIGGGCGMHGSGGAAYGGAVANNSSTVDIKHATLSLNNAQGGNSGVNQGGATKPARLVAEGAGGGIRPGFGTVTLENTIIAANTAANGTGDTTGAPVPGPDVDGTVTSNDHNLLGLATEANGFGGTGDGGTAPDWLIVNPHHVELRAERAGTGAGRVYTITVACTDGSNNTTTKTVTVFVPKSRK
jgi:hypothetical protein